MIKRIIEETGVESIDIDDEGKVLIASMDREASVRGLDFVNGLVKAPEVGKIYDAKVVKVMNFGAFANLCLESKGSFMFLRSRVSMSKMLMM